MQSQLGMKMSCHIVAIAGNSNPKNFMQKWAQ